MKTWAGLTETKIRKGVRLIDFYRLTKTDNGWEIAPMFFPDRVVHTVDTLNEAREWIAGEEP